jgi:hypothetical protein
VAVDPLDITADTATTRARNGASAGETDERLRVLELVAAGSVTPEQGAELLQALQSTRHGAANATVGTAGNGSRTGRPLERAAVHGAANGATPAGEPGRAPGYLLSADRRADGAQWLRVRVTDRQRLVLADVRLPLSIVGVALRLGARWIPQLRLLDTAFVLATLRLRQGQPVFHYQDDTGGERIEITVE